MKSVLMFAKNDQTLVEICTVVLHLGSDVCQIKLLNLLGMMSDVGLLFHSLKVGIFLKVGTLLDYQWLYHGKCTVNMS